LNVGAGAGALIGASIPLIGNSHSTSATLSAAAVGAIVGVSGIAASFNSADKSGPSSPSSPGRFRSRHSDAGPRLTVGSTSLVAALAGVPGRHVLARLIF
jgi:hypothetical protein